MIIKKIIPQKEKYFLSFEAGEILALNYNVVENEKKNSAAVRLPIKLHN